MQKEISYDVEKIVLNACSLLEQGEVRVGVPYIPIAKYKEVFEKLGTWDNDFDTNGWDVDFWIYFYINDIKYCLSGSWFYGIYSISKMIDTIDETPKEVNKSKDTAVHTVGAGDAVLEIVGSIIEGIGEALS